MFTNNLRLVPRYMYARTMTNATLAARNRIVWMDLEVNLFQMNSHSSISLVTIYLQMTGLDDTKDHILEAACLITDQELNIVAEGPNIIINQPNSILDAMGDWCKKTHGEVQIIH